MEYRAEIVFSLDVCLRVCAQCTLNANSSKTVQSTDVKFDLRVFTDSPDMMR